MSRIWLVGVSSSWLVDLHYTPHHSWSTFLLSGSTRYFMFTLYFSRLRQAAFFSRSSGSFCGKWYLTVKLSTLLPGLPETELAMCIVCTNNTWVHIHGKRGSATRTLLYAGSLLTHVQVQHPLPSQCPLSSHSTLGCPLHTWASLMCRNPPHCTCADNGHHLFLPHPTLASFPLPTPGPPKPVCSRRCFAPIYDWAGRRGKRWAVWSSWCKHTDILPCE